jgi:rhodanese-related sulfurtransferase
MTQQPARIDRHLAEQRNQLQRVQPDELIRYVEADALIVDTRPIEQRDRDGALPGAVVIDRNVLEWRLDPTSPHRIPEATPGRQVVIVCNEGYSSSLAAMSLQAIGLADATDLVDGYQGLLGSGALAVLEARSDPGRTSSAGSTS